MRETRFTFGLDKGFSFESDFLGDGFSFFRDVTTDSDGRLASTSSPEDSTVDCT